MRLAGRRTRRLALAGAAVVTALAGAPVAGVPAASAGTGETVIVTATGLLSPAAAVLSMGGSVLAQFHLINGVEAVIPAAAEPLLAALPTRRAARSAKRVVTYSSLCQHGPHVCRTRKSRPARQAAEGQRL